MPIYEFVCEACGERFEELVEAGTEGVACRACGAAGAGRVMSAPGRVPQLVKTPRESRRLEEARGVTRGGAKSRFKEARRKAREAAARRAGGEGR